MGNLGCTGCKLELNGERLDGHCGLICAEGVGLLGAGAGGVVGGRGRAAYLFYLPTGIQSALVPAGGKVVITRPAHT